MILSEKIEFKLKNALFHEISRKVHTNNAAMSLLVLNRKNKSTLILLEVTLN